MFGVDLAFTDRAPRIGLWPPLQPAHRGGLVIATSGYGAVVHRVCDRG